MHNAFQESSKFAPFQAMFGRMARLPIDINLTHSNPKVRIDTFTNLNEPNEEEQIFQRENMEAAIKSNICKAQSKQKERYDQIHAASTCFKVKSLVLTR